MKTIDDLNILIVDDDISVQSRLELFLNGRVDDIYSARDGLEAMQIMENNKIDVVISDINMPRMDGLELLGKIRWSYPGTKIAIMSGETQGLVRKETILTQGYEFLEKPVNLDNVLKFLNSTLDKIEPSKVKSKSSPGTVIVKNPVSKVNVPNKMKKWISMYKLLKNYREKKPDKWPTRLEYFKGKRLGYWVNIQRRDFKNYKAGISSNIDEEKIKLLNEIGFVWDAKMSRWMEKYKVLKEFRRKNPDRWPTSAGQEETLANWCSVQRHEYKKFIAKTPTTLDEERIKLLNDIGFKWCSKTVLDLLKE